jgi:hypothetical protein
VFWGADTVLAESCLYCGSAAWGGDHVEVCVYLGRALAHVAEAQARVWVVGVEAAAVVADAHYQDRAYLAGLQVYVVCMGVLGYVPERLDGDPVQGGGLGRVQGFEGSLEVVVGLAAELFLVLLQALAEVVSRSRGAFLAQDGEFVVRE